MDLCESIQLAADCVDIHAMYEGMKKAFTSSTIKTAPLKSKSGFLITDKGKQMERWVEHYQELYAYENTVTDAAVHNITICPIMEELDQPPTLDELHKTIDSLANGKAPGSDGIPTEVIKAGKDCTLLEQLHKFLFQCWEEGEVP